MERDTGKGTSIHPSPAREGFLSNLPRLNKLRARFSVGTNPLGPDIAPAEEAESPV